MYSAMIRIDKILNPTPGAPPTTPPSSPPHDPSADTRDRGASRGSRVKLPKLTIHPFNGNLTNWMMFWDSFEAAIHKNGELSDVDNLTICICC